MNENLAYWQLDFTVESQANLAPDCMVMQEKSKSFRGLGGPQTPGLFHSSAYGLRHSTVFRYFLQSLVSSLIIASGYLTGEHYACRPCFYKLVCCTSALIFSDFDFLQVLFINSRIILRKIGLKRGSSDHENELDKVPGIVAIVV